MHGLIAALWLTVLPDLGGQCIAPPDYYAIDLIPTRRIPAALMSEGTAHVSFVDSPFGLAMTPDGSYLYDVQLTVSGLGQVSGGTYVAWISTPDLSEVLRLGPLSADGLAHGQVSWNKFIVIVTLESQDHPLGDRWQGPVALRGLSRSGLMHTMAGHGPFQQEPCAVYGYY